MNRVSIGIAPTWLTLLQVGWSFSLATAWSKLISAEGERRSAAHADQIGVLDVRAQARPVHNVRRKARAEIARAGGDGEEINAAGGETGAVQRFFQGADGKNNGCLFKAGDLAAPVESSPVLAGEVSPRVQPVVLT